MIRPNNNNNHNNGNYADNENKINGIKGDIDLF